MSAVAIEGTASVSRKSWLTLAAMTGSLSMILLDQTVVSVALPTMSRDLPLSTSGAQWVVNAYVLAMAAFVALGGKLGSKLGPVTTFRVGVLVFFVASAFCGLAPVGSQGETWLICARVVQGVGAALMMPVTAVIVMAAFPESVRGRAMGAYVGIGQIFLALGPLVGGACTEWLSWRVVFWLNVPVGLAALVLVSVAKPANDKQSALRIAASHVVLLVAGIGTTVYALQQAGSWGWGSTRMLATLGVGLVVLAAFVVVQLRSEEPLVDLRLFRHLAFVGDMIVLFGTQFGLLVITLFAALYAQNLLGYSPVQAGFSSMAMILPLMIGAQFAGRWYDRSGVRPPLLLGLVLCTAGALVWALQLPHIEYWSKVPGMALTGLGLGLVFSPVNTDALSRVPARERSQASGIVQTVRQLGGTLGVAVIGAIILANEQPQATPAAAISNTAHAMSIGFMFSAGTFALTLVGAWFLLSRKRPAPEALATPVEAF
jgi:EmrB/QacA subfamily drug resistance transporter